MQDEPNVTIYSNKNVDCRSPMIDRRTTSSESAFMNRIMNSDDFYLNAFQRTNGYCPLILNAICHSFQAMRIILMYYSVSRVETKMPLLCFTKIKVT
jgi:hypothetical protein